MGISTLIKTLTASDSASLEFVDGTSDVVLDSTYDEYIFVCTDINPATDGPNFGWQVNATDDAGGGYDTSLFTSTAVEATHGESDSPAQVTYIGGSDQAQGSSYQRLADSIGNGGDESCAGVLHLFSPASTTYVKHFYSTFSQYDSGNKAGGYYMAGYINDTTAIDEIKFYMSSGNFDGVIQLYGIA